MALKITCGFGRVGVRESKFLGLTEEEKQTKKHSQPNLEQQYTAYTNIYAEGKENELDKQDFSDSDKHVRKVLNTWTQNRRHEKVKFLAHFSINKWEKLSAEEKAKHSVVGPCKECLLRHGAFWELFNKQIKSAKVRNVLNTSSTHLNESNKRQTPKIDQSTKRKLLRQFKSDLEAADRLHDKDVEAVFATGESLRSRRKRRLLKEFETKEQAAQRTKKRKILEELGERKRPNKLGNFENWARFDQEGLIEEVQSYKDGDSVNWTELARKYEIKTPDGKVPSNAGQLLKLWLENQDVNTDRFNSNKPPSNVIRRARVKVGRGTGVTVLRDRTERHVSQHLRGMVKDGKVPIGEPVGSRQFLKYVLNRQTNKIETKVVTVEGRKQTLLDIRKQLLTSQQRFMRDPSDYDKMTEDELKQRLVELGEQVPPDRASMIQHLSTLATTRNLMMWEDGATVGNRAHIVYTVATVYDPAVYLTDSEYFDKFKVRLSVQSKVEQPVLYIIARSGSSDAEQLLYTQTRCDDLPSLAILLEAPDGRKFKDVLRFFKGDNPARQFEMGEQRGGFHPCLCPVDIRGVHSFWTCTHTDDPALTIQDRQQFILEGPVTRQKASSTLPDPFDHLTKEEMLDELTYRGTVSYEQAENMTKKDAKQEWKTTRHGIKRSPALLCPNPTQTTDQLNIQTLEAPASESMHDIYNHAKNIFEELPAHVPKEVAETIQRVKDTILGGQETVRASHMRYLTLVATKQLEEQGKARHEVMQLLYTLVEIQRLCYLPADQRNMTNIFRLSNTIFLHHLMMKEIFGTDLKNLTTRKLWGLYIHALRDHTTVVARIAPPSSLNAENEERQFSTYKRITKSSACYGAPGHLTANIFIRTYFSQKLGQSENHDSHCDNKISQLAKLFPQERTRYSVELLKKHPREAQAHYERISDFMRPGYAVHWHADGGDIVHHDSPSQDPPFHPAGPAMHHFRSTTIKQEHEYLDETWQRCLEEEVPLPLSKLRIYNGQTLTKKITLPFLDPGYDFSQQFSYMKEGAQGTAEEEAEEEAEEVTVEEDPDGEEAEEEEEVIRMERLDPEPELDEFEDSNTMQPGMQAAPSHVQNPDQSPCSIRTGQMGEARCLSFMATPPRTPVQEAGPTRSTSDVHSSNIQSTPAGCSRAGKALQDRGGAMTPPETPKDPVGNRKRDEPKWQTKLGSALAVVMEDLAAVQCIDRLKAKLKMDPRNKFIKAEYDNCVAKVSTKLSKILHEERKNFKTWEKVFMSEKGRLPTATDVGESADASANEKRIRYAEHLLRSFGVNLHMI